MHESVVYTVPAAPKGGQTRILERRMIPRGRMVITTEQLARRAGVSMWVWRDRYAPDFREQVPNLFAGRFLIYDLEQAHAYLDGKRVALPAGEDPNDLLNDREAATVLKVKAGTVQKYREQGYLSGTHPLSTEGPLKSISVVARRDVEHRRDHPIGQGVGGGPRPRIAYPYEGDSRLKVAAAARRGAGNVSRRRLAISLAEEHGGIPRTWERILAEVEKHR